MADRVRSASFLPRLARSPREPCPPNHHQRPKIAANIGESAMVGWLGRSLWATEHKAVGNAPNVIGSRAIPA